MLNPLNFLSKILKTSNQKKLDKLKKAVKKINDLEWELDNEGCPKFSFWLHKGTYATSFLREIMKCEDVKVY